jgi:putative methanogenesis marker protein 8
MDKHVWEIGKSKVIVSGGKVASVVSEPLTKFCPVIYTTWGTEKQTKETVKKSIEFRIGAFGLCTPKRILETDISAVGFGASESLMTALKQEIIDASATVCDGAGTVITEKPTLVEGIGIFMSALIETTPIPEVIGQLEKKGATILNPQTAEINQVAGVEKAFKMGFRKVGVTVMGPDAQAIPKIRLLEEKNQATTFIIVMHTTGIGEELVPFIEKADIVHGCSSKVVRETIEPKALSTFGKNIPAYALTKLGEEVLRLQEKAVSKNKQIVKIAFIRPPFPLS